MKLALRVSLFLAFFVFSVTPLPAQQGTGKITGRVADATGALIPGVTVSLTSPSVMGVRTFVSDERGLYLFDLLPPGTYALKFELQGFKTLIREGLQITAGFTATVNVDLEVATVAETVTVTGESPVVNLESSSLSTNFTTSLLQNLPNGRDIWSTLGQTPGIVMTLFDVGGSQAGNYSPYRTYGTANGPDDYLNLDGVRYNYMYLDYGSYEEMQVVAASKSAEVRNAGVYMNSIVKTGGNDIHAMAYAGFTPQSFKGSNLNDTLRGFGLTTTNKLTFFSDLNGNIGGPVKKDKLWWFLSARDNYIGISSPGFIAGGCKTALACTGKPLGTFVNDDTTSQGDFYTRLVNVTLKLNGQITPKNQVSALANFSDKRYPFRGGSGATAGFFTTDSVARQTYPGWIYKLQWTSVINNQITLDTSLNRNGYHWPNDRRVDEYSRRDLDTLIVRGGYSGSGTGFSSQFPQTFDPTDHQFNISLSMLTDHFITGSHNIKIGYTYKYETVTTKIGGTLGQIVLYYRGGFQTPAFIDTLDAPFTQQNGLKENSFFIQDTWKLTSRLTINPGFRLDRAVSFYPQETKKGIGPYQSPQTIPGKDIVPISGPVPRFSFVYDIFGNGKTALKGGYSRYNIDAGGTEEPGVATASNPIGLTQSRYVWTGTGGQPSANCYLTGCSFNPTALGLTPVSVTGGPNRAVDPNLKFPYVDEYTLGIDQQLKNDFSLRLNFVQKYDKDRWQYFNSAIPFGAYDIPVTATDPGRAGLASRALTFFSLERPYVGLRKDFITNNPALNNTNTTFEASITKRLSNKWQIMTGWDYLHRKVWTQNQVAGNSTGFADDPNNLIYNNGENYNTWTYKAMGTYYAPYGFVLSSVLRTAKGLPYGRQLNSPAMNQGVVNVYVEPIGTFFMDSQKLLDIRAEKTFNLSDRSKLGVILDLFNTLNASTVTGVNSQTGAKFGYPTSTVEPRTARVSMRYTF